MENKIEKYDAVLTDSSLFAGISAEDIHSMLGCLAAREKNYRKGDFIHHPGDCIHTIGLVLTGCVHLLKEDLWGNANLMAECRPGEIFGEAYAICGDKPLELSVQAAASSRILFLNLQKMLTTCGSSCEFHNRLIHNLVVVMSEKNFSLSRKLEHMSKRTTREKLLSYLSAEAIRQERMEFDIPFNRQQLADYLSVDRSAMSSELGKLQAEGYFTFRKNHFLMHTLGDDYSTPFVFKKSTQTSYLEP